LDRKCTPIINKLLKINRNFNLFKLLTFLPTLMQYSIFINISIY
jgi:hypothetical protein